MIPKSLVGYRWSMQKMAAWADVFAKAKRLKDEGRCIIQRNGYDNVVAMVRGDYGVYEVEFNRQDPASRAITMWSCTCPWAQFVWFRTGPWKKYEGRVCSHTLAAYWAAKGTPLDEDALQDWSDKNDFAQAIPGQEPQPNEMEQAEDESAIPDGLEGPGAQMLDGPEDELPDETDELMPSELPIEPDLTSGPLPKQPELPFKPQTPGEEANDPQLQTPNPIEQGLLEIQKNLGPDQFNFLKKQYPDFFKIPGVISKVSGVDDFEMILKMLRPDPGKNMQTPTCQMLKPELGEMRGGVNPHPEARPAGKRKDGTPLYNLEDMGWHPQEGKMYDLDRVHQVPERRGDYGEIPVGAHVSVLDADPTTKWVLVDYPLPGDGGAALNYCQHRRIEAWVDSSAVKLVGNESMRPDIQRRMPPTPDQQWDPGAASDDWA